MQIRMDHQLMIINLKFKRWIIHQQHFICPKNSYFPCIFIINYKELKLI